MKENDEKIALTIEHTGLRVAVENGVSVSSAAASGGSPIRADCGLKGVCGKCKVFLSPPSSFSPLTDAEKRLLTGEDIEKNARLACQANIQGAGRVFIPLESRESGEVVSKDIDYTPGPVDPVVERVVFSPGKGGFRPKAASRDLVSELKETINREVGRDLDFSDQAVCRSLAGADSLAGPVTFAVRNNGRVSGVIPGDCRRSLGAAVDLGTTTIAVYLCDLSTGDLIAAAAGTNPQRFYGEDVISRIGVAAASEEGMNSLRTAASGAINALTASCLASAGADPMDVDEITVVGNTTMECILAGINPQRLGRSPYLPVTQFLGEFAAEEIGLATAPGARVYFAPVVSGFIGGDALAAVMSTQTHETDGISLVVDLGTNGELVLGGKGGLWAASCATGPVFEGAHISCGMRASRGAVTAMDIDGQTRKPSFELYGGNDVEPLGICGSGLIDAVAALRRTGLLAADGRFTQTNNTQPEEYPIYQGPGQEGRRVFVSQKDIRQVQLARSALNIGAEYLLQASAAAGVDRLILTGAMGMYFNWSNAMGIGLLPPKVFENKVEQTANAAGAGAVRLLLDKKARVEAVDLAGRIKIVDLAANPDFQKDFISALQFPEFA